MAALEPAGALWIAIQPRASAAAIEALPLALGLRQAVGNRVPGKRVEAETEMARLDLDVLVQRAFLFDTALPCDHAVGAAEDRRHRHGGRHAQRGVNVRRADRVTGNQF